MDRILEFAGNHTLLVTALMASFFLVVFSELRRKASGLINIEAGDAVKLINNDALVVDLRSVDAFSRGHIVNARNIPSDELEAKMSTLRRLRYGYFVDPRRQYVSPAGLRECLWAEGWHDGLVTSRIAGGYRQKDEEQDRKGQEAELSAA
jgi:hypothetical protein